MTYAIRPGSFFKKDDAAIIGPELDRIAAEEGGIVPEEVIQRARFDDSPLHRYFEWDDSAAAHQHRLWQARHMIGSIVIIEAAGPEPPVRAYWSLTEPEDTARSYIPLPDILTNEFRVRQVIARFERDIARMQADYKSFRAVAAFSEVAEPVLAAVDKVRARRTRRKAA